MPLKMHLVNQSQNVKTYCIQSFKRLFMHKQTNERSNKREEKKMVTSHVRYGAFRKKKYRRDEEQLNNTKTCNRIKKKISHKCGTHEYFLFLYFVFDYEKQGQNRR